MRVCFSCPVSASHKCIGSVPTAAGCQRGPIRREPHRTTSCESAFYLPPWATTHNRMVRSLPLLASVVPFGENAIEFTDWVCPCEG